MSNCCSHANATNGLPTKDHCPACGNLGNKVDTQTILQHIQDPWRWKPSAQNYYFCASPGCEIAYFGDDNSLVKTRELRTDIGIKQESDEALICYCFGITRKIARTDPQARAFVIEQTKNQHCDCINRNPSGQCCLKDFP